MLELLVSVYAEPLVVRGGHAVYAQQLSVLRRSECTLNGCIY